MALSIAVMVNEGLPRVCRHSRTITPIHVVISKYLMIFLALSDNRSSI